MTVFEYLKLKYKTETPSALLSQEAKIFGIGYPMEGRWLVNSGGIEITEEMSIELRDYLTRNPSKLNAARAIMILGGDLTETEKCDLYKERDYVKTTYGSMDKYDKAVLARKSSPF